MAYSKAQGRATAKYDKEHYYRGAVKIKKEVFEEMKKCSRFQNVNQFLNLLIMEELEKEGLTVGTAGSDGK